jgi:hypothetical protein
VKDHSQPIEKPVVPGIVLKISETDFDATGAVESLAEIVDLQDDGVLEMVLRSWLKLMNGGPEENDIESLVKKSPLGLTAAVPVLKSDDETEMKLLLPGRLKVKQQLREQQAIQMLLRNAKPAIVSKLCNVPVQRCYWLKNREKQQLHRGLSKLEINSSRPQMTQMKMRVVNCVLRLLNESSAR